MKISILGPNDPALKVYSDLASTQQDPNFKVSIISWAEYHDVLMQALNETVSPHHAVFIPGHLWIPGFAMDKRLADLNPLIQQLPATIWENYQPGDIIDHIAEESFFEGNRYTIPVFNDGHILFYRSDILDLDRPGNPKELSPLGLHSLAAGAHNPPEIYGLALKAHPSEILLDWLPFFFEAGGTLLNAASHPDFDSEAGIEALRYYCQLKQYCPPDTDQYGNVEIARILKQGRAALVATWGGQAAPIFLDEKNPYRERYRTATYPYPCGATWGIAIPANQPEQSQLEALKTILELNEPARDIDVMLTAGSPVRESSYSMEHLDRYSWLRAQYAISHRLMLLPKRPEIGAFFGPLTEALVNAFAGRVNPEQALQKAEKMVRAALAI